MFVGISLIFIAHINNKGGCYTFFEDGYTNDGQIESLIHSQVQWFDLSVLQSLTACLSYVHVYSFVVVFLPMVE